MTHQKWIKAGAKPVVLLAAGALLLGGCGGTVRDKPYTDLGVEMKSGTHQRGSGTIIVGQEKVGGVPLAFESGGKVWIPLEHAAEIVNMKLHRHSTNGSFAIGDTDPAFHLQLGSRKAWSGSRMIELPEAPRMIGGKPSITAESLTALLETSVKWHHNKRELTVMPIKDTADGSGHKRTLKEMTTKSTSKHKKHPAASSSGTAKPTAKPAGPGSGVTTPVATPAGPGSGVTTPVATPAGPGSGVTTPVATPAGSGSGVTTPVATPAGPGSGVTTPVATPAGPGSGVTTPVATPAGSGSGVTTPVATPAGSGSDGTIAPLSNGNIQQMLQLAQTFLGTPYNFGSGSYTQTHTFDCSSFVQYLYGKIGIHLPRTSREQSQVGQTITADDLQPGDLMFFYTPGRYATNTVVGHVGIYYGDGKIIQTYGTPGVVISDFSKYWHGRFLFGKRVTS